MKTIKCENGDVILIAWDVMGHLAGWIDGLTRIAKDLPDVGVLSALLLKEENKIFWHGGQITPNLMLPHSRASDQEWLGQYPGTTETDVVLFKCCLITKKLLEKQPLPENIENDPFVAADYCLEAQKLGYKIFTTDEVLVHFYQRPQPGGKVKQLADALENSQKEFSKKWGKKIQKQYGTPVVISTSVDSPTGFSKAARGFIHGLYDNNVKVFYNFLLGLYGNEEYISDEVVNDTTEAIATMKAPQITWAQAPYFFRNSGDYKIGFCEFEGEPIPAEWVPYCNMMNELWVPTDWNRGLFRKAGVKVPIYVFPQGVDPAYFNPTMAPMRFDIKENFKFLCVAAWEPRKNLPNLIRAYQAEFKFDENVCLIIKTAEFGLGKKVREELKEIKSADDAGKVYVRKQVIPDEQLGCLYTGAHCFVLPSHGEGFGLPLFEALACGLPVITTDYGAPAELLRDKKGEPLPGVNFVAQHLTKAITPYIYMENTYWAEPSITDLRKKLREVYQNYQEQRAGALKTGAMIRQDYSWKKVCRQIKERLNDIDKERKKLS